MWLAEITAAVPGNICSILPPPSSVFLPRESFFCFGHHEPQLCRAGKEPDPCESNPHPILSISFFSRPKQTTNPLIPLNIHPWSTIKESVFQSKTLLSEGVSLYCSALQMGDLIDLTRGRHMLASRFIMRLNLWLAVAVKHWGPWNQACGWAGYKQLGRAALNPLPAGPRDRPWRLECSGCSWHGFQKQFWWQCGAVTPGLPQNNTLSAYVNRLPFLQRSQNAFHLVSVLQVLLSVFYGQQNQDTARPLSSAMWVWVVRGWPWETCASWVSGCCKTASSNLSKLLPEWSCWLADLRGWWELKGTHVFQTPWKRVVLKTHTQASVHHVGTQMKAVGCFSTGLCDHTWWGLHPTGSTWKWAEDMTPSSLLGLLSYEA